MSELHFILKDTTWFSPEQAQQLAESGALPSLEEELAFRRLHPQEYEMLHRMDDGDDRLTRLFVRLVTFLVTLVNRRRARLHWTRRMLMNDGRVLTVHIHNNK